jgi:hypothetical protein
MAAIVVAVEQEIQLPDRCILPLTTIARATTTTTHIAFLHPCEHRIASNNIELLVTAILLELSRRAKWMMIALFHRDVDLISIYVVER